MRKRATKQQIAASVGLLAAVAGAGYFWWPHIYFKFQLARNEVRIASVPVTELKAPGRTAGWADCRIGPVSLKLPSALAENADRSVEQGTISFSTPGQQFSTNIPFRIDPQTRAEHAKLADEFKMSPTRLIAESYRKGTDDFRWSMSREELRHLQVLLQMGVSNFPHSHAMAVETRFDGAVEGVLIHGDRQAAIFHWQTTSGVAFGVLLFRQKEGDLDLDWVRDVCKSLACDESRLGDKESSKKDLRELLEMIEVKPGGGD
ncbi:MAG: hypothetical protein ACM3U2_16150 [Deltaproteobacteria bacterium]